MMKIYICPKCGWLRLVSRRKFVECHKCGHQEMRLSNLDYKRYSSMTLQERKDYSDAWMYIHKNKG